MAGFFKKLVTKITNQGAVDWEDLEADLIGGDLGVRLSLEIVDELRERDPRPTAEEIAEVARQRLAQVFPEDQKTFPEPQDGKPIVLMMVGVNGVGKTTSAAKLASLLKQQNRKVMLAAADTFRAAAVEQLVRWGERLQVPVVTGKHEADPSSVCFKAHREAIEGNYEYLICDTAGRLHTRHNLMEELAKIKRTIAKQDEKAPHQAYIVVDATTGGNALNQVKEFGKAVALDGVILTKMDGSGKGGVAAAIMNELKTPPRFIGTGEEAHQFQHFDREDYVQNIL